MSLSRLMTTLQPPGTPREGAVDWVKVQAQLGVPLPADYKEFVSVYGTGAINDFLWVLNPASTNPNLNLLAQRDVRLDALRTFKLQHPSRVPFAIFPEPAGLLPWGATDNGDVCYWETSPPQADLWPSVVFDSRHAQWERVERTMTAFINDLLARRYRTRIFPTDFLSSGPTFLPVVP